jgi:hypothetical protein
MYPRGTIQRHESRPGRICRERWLPLLHGYSYSAHHSRVPFDLHINPLKRINLVEVRCFRVTLCSRQEVEREIKDDAF